MASHGIKDQVAIIGMGCTQFKEHWDRSADDLMIDAVGDTLASAGVAKDDIDAWWLGTAAATPPRRRAWSGSRPLSRRPKTRSRR